ATVDVDVSEEAVTYVHQLTPRVRIVMEYYAEVLYRLGLCEASQQLVQYMGALCLHLLDEIELKRVNILGSLLELLYQKPENLEITYQQSVILFRNQDGSMEAEVQEPLLPEEYYLPTSVLLLLQNMLYTLGEDEMSCLIMAISAMHTFYATRYGYAQEEARRLASRHALQQVEANLSR
ncbi:MAG: hypothetical protein FWE76_04125, partial [Symbiobacteriaceae bacterium]|nr:hypothetical protein [Symbiobacteriaceae bacterium]